MIQVVGVSVRVNLKTLGVWVRVDRRIGDFSSRASHSASCRSVTWWQEIDVSFERVRWCEREGERGRERQTDC